MDNSNNKMRNILLAILMAELIAFKYIGVVWGTLLMKVQVSDLVFQVELYICILVSCEIAYNSNNNKRKRNILLAILMAEIIVFEYICVVWGSLVMKIQVNDFVFQVALYICILVSCELVYKGIIKKYKYS